MIESLGLNTNVSIRASVLTGDLQFDALAEEWDELLEHSDQHVYFLRWAWNRLWWQWLRPSDSQLFIIICRDQYDTLVGLAPFYLRQKRTAGIPHLRELRFLGTGVYAQTSEYLDIVTRRGYEPAVVNSIVDCLDQSDDWDRLCLNEIPSSSATLPYLSEALGDDIQIEACNRSYYVDTSVDWKTFVKGLGNSARDNVVRRTRRLFETGDWRVKRVETPDELERAMDALVRLHQARWESKGEPGTFALPNIEAFLKGAMRSSLRDGRLGFTTLEVGAEIAAARVDFVDNHIAHWFQAGFDPAYARQGIGSVMNGLCIRACIEDDRINEYDLMGGGADYKESWTKDYKESVTVTLARPGVRSTAYSGIERAKVMGRSVLRATLPQSLRIAGHRLITQRHYRRVPE